MKVPASAWNRLVDYLFRHRLLSVVSLEGSQWRHSWFTSARWDAEAKSWLANVRPGFVNGQDVTVSVVVDEEMKNVPLTEDPAFPLSQFRAIGTDTISIDGTGEPVPPFFVKLGVKGARSLSTEGDAGITETITGLPEDAAEALPPRQLRACDIVLRCLRPRTAVEWLITPAETGAQAQITLLTTGSSAHQASLRVTSRYQPIQAAADLTRLEGLVTDPGYDEAHVCTVYLLSPENAGPETEIDATWTPYVRHHLFWNAEYLTTQPTIIPRQNLELNLAGLGGIAGAQFTVNQLLSLQNDATNNALAFLLGNEITGKISTPGHSKGSIQWDESESLDPPFPFFGIG
jgi:hypothetical protein